MICKSVTGGLAILVLGFPMTPAAMLVFTFVSRGGVMGASSATWVVTPGQCCACWM